MSDNTSIQHSPLPWETRGVDEITTDSETEIWRIEIGVPGYGEVAAAFGVSMNEAVANAAFIVRAVNLHDDLVSLIERMLHGDVLNDPPWDEARRLLSLARGEV